MELKEDLKYSSGIKEITEIVNLIDEVDVDELKYSIESFQMNTETISNNNNSNIADVYIIRNIETIWTEQNMVGAHFLPNHDLESLPNKTEPHSGSSGEELDKTDETNTLDLESDLITKTPIMFDSNNDLSETCPGSTDFSKSLKKLTKENGYFNESNQYLEHNVFENEASKEISSTVEKNAFTNSQLNNKNVSPINDLVSNSLREKRKSLGVSMKQVKISLARENLEEKLERIHARFQENKNKKLENKMKKEVEEDSKQFYAIRRKLRKRNIKNLGQRHAPREIGLKIIETTDGKFKCGYCCFQKDVRQPVRRHFYLKHFRTYICYHCQHQTYCRTGFISHLSVHQNKDKMEYYKCEHCSFKTKSMTSIKAHRNSHKKHPLIFKCFKCSFQTKHKSSLKSHIFNHSKIKTITIHECSKCEYKSKYLKYLQKHEIVHKENYELKKYKCNQCSYATKSKHHLERHFAIHSDQALAECTQCKFQTRHKEYMKQHMLLHENVDDAKTFACNFCSFQTIHKVSLKSHLILHKSTDDLELFKCLHCDFKTKQKGYLRIHIRSTHDKSEEFCCYVCGFKTYRKTDLIGHVRIHSETAFGKCPYCSFQSRQQNHLREHLLRHESIENIRHYKCNFCSFRTRHLSYIKKHRIIRHKTMNEVDMYKCPHCNYHSKLKQPLEIHIKRIHKKESQLFSCFNCEYKCFSKFYLKKHVKVHQHDVKSLLTQKQMDYHEG